MEGEPSSDKSRAFPSELMGRTPHRVRLTGTGWLYAFASAFFIFLAVYFAVKIVHLINDEETTRSALQQSGGQTLGKVTGKSTEGRGQGYISYEFEVDGTIYYGKSATSIDVWNSLHEGDSLSVRYLPTTPDISCPAAWEDPTSLNWWALLFPGFLAIMSAGFVWRFPLQYRVAVNGVPAWACVAEREWKGPSRGPHWENYTFRNAEDEVQFGRCPMDVTLRAGATVCVLFLPKKPIVSHVYPLDFFEVNQ
jgi:hypothetical protein